MLVQILRKATWFPGSPSPRLRETLGTMLCFADQADAWSAIAYGNLNLHSNVVFIRRFEANVTIAPINQLKYSVHSAFSGFRFDFRSDSGLGFDKYEGLVVSKPPNIPA